MRCLLLALAVAGCADTHAIPDAPDARPPLDDGEIIQWPEDGDYDVEWLSGGLKCDAITLSDSALGLAACGLELAGVELETCRRFEGGDRDWHLCPNVGFLHGQIREGNVVRSEFRAYRH